jgi:hypothetical protein
MPKKNPDILLLSEADNLNYLALCAFISGEPIRRTSDRTIKDKISDATKISLLSKQDYCCKDCGFEFVPKNGLWKTVTADHVIKYQYGGQCNANNIDLVCQPCNNKRDQDYSLEVIERNYGRIDMALIQPFFRIRQPKRMNNVSRTPIKY